MKGAGARVGDGGERAKQLSRVRRAFVDFNKRAANAGSAFCRVRRAFVDLRIVLLSINGMDSVNLD